MAAAAAGGSRTPAAPRSPLRLASPPPPRHTAARGWRRAPASGACGPLARAAALCGLGPQMRVQETQTSKGCSAPAGAGPRRTGRGETNPEKSKRICTMCRSFVDTCATQEVVSPLGMGRMHRMYIYSGIRTPLCILYHKSAGMSTGTAQECKLLLWAGARGCAASEAFDQRSKALRILLPCGPRPHKAAHKSSASAAQRPCPAREAPLPN